MKKNYKANAKLTNDRRWSELFSHVWFNRFAYMTPEMFQRERKQAESYIKKPNVKTTQQTKNKIKEKLTRTKDIAKYMKKHPEAKVIRQSDLEQTGKGLKKNYVTLPSDPAELVDRLTLLAGSKDAGNTGVYNEMVSICDELLKKKIIGKGQYKQFLSNI